MEGYQTRLRQAQRLLEDVNTDMTRDRRMGTDVPNLAQVKVLQGITQIRAARGMITTAARRLAS